MREDKKVGGRAKFALALPSVNKISEGNFIGISIAFLKFLCADPGAGGGPLSNYKYNRQL